MRNRHMTCVVVAVVAGYAFAVAALASPGFGTTATNLATENFDHTVFANSDRVKFQTKDATDVRVQRIDFIAGSYTGWHHHPGIVLVVVESGAVTLWKSDCSSTLYGPGLPDGAVFAEGGDEPQQATSAGGATIYVTYVAPSADPRVFRIEDAAVTCP